MNGQPVDSSQPSVEDTVPTIGDPGAFQANQEVASEPLGSPKTPGHKLKYALTAFLVAVILGVTLFIAYIKLTPKTSYQDVVKQFITAMQHQDRATVAKLESPTTQKVLQRYDGNSNLYDVCSKIGNSCMGIYNSTFFNMATISISNYDPGGKNVRYSSTSGGCKTLMTFQLIPHGNSWLIDHINENYTSPVKTCTGSVTGSSSAPGNKVD